MTDLKDSPPPEDSMLSERDERLLNYLALVAQILQRQINPPAAQKEKTFRSAFREPSVIATLITVVIGGIAATLITAMVQRDAGNREFEQTWLKSRGDQALVSYKEYLDQEQALMRRIYSLIGASVSASDRLTGLTKSSWRQRFVGAELIAVRTQMRVIRDNYNQTNTKWHSEGEELGLLIDYYHPGHPKLKSSWKTVQSAVTDYLDCAEKYYLTHPQTQPAPRDEEITQACKPKHDSLVASLDELTNNLESSRRYAWTGWESPKDIKSLIERSRASSAP